MIRQSVWLRRDEQQLLARTSIAIAADGLARSCLRDLGEFESRVAADAQIGVGATVSGDGLESEFSAGTIYMAVVEHGYVGVVRLANGQLNVAAAIDPGALRLASSTAEILGELFQAAGFCVPAGLHEADWQGTTALTRRSNRVAGHRILVAGDAGGYVEPFTGEGMAWAVTTGAAVADLCCDLNGEWPESIGSVWESHYSKLVRKHQFWCRSLVRLLRYPTIVGASLKLVSTFPWMTRPILRHLNAPLKSDLQFGHSNQGRDHGI